ncbi:MAG: flagellar biosynthesis protein FlhB [Magnetovibrionaceae bacterium]
MADEDDSSKTEEPTSKRLAQAKEEGNTPKSEEVKNWSVLLASTLALAFMGPMIAGDTFQMARKFIEQPHAIPMDFNHIRLVFADVFGDMGIALWPIMLLLSIVAVASNVAQSGLIFAAKKIKPDLSKLNLIKGLKQKVSSRALVEFLKGLAKIGIVAVVGTAVSLPFFSDIALLPDKSLFVSLDRLLTVSLVMASATVAVLTFLAVLDFIYQRYKFMKDMRMTKQQVKDEHKQSEGDPHVKAKIRQMRFERAQRRMMASVPNASVVITNPTHYACALEYDMEAMGAPRLVAKGVDQIAFKIREIAEFHEVPIVENPPLARALHASVELDEEIPPEHYKAVAEVIGYVMNMKGGGRSGGQGARQ